MNLVEQLRLGQTKLAVIGLGYVGLPLATAFAKAVQVVGYDINVEKIEKLNQYIDLTGDVGNEVLRDSTAQFTCDEERLQEASVFVVTVPTPVQQSHVPDLRFLERASRTIAKYLTVGSLVVYESTVYPGVTEEICIPILEQHAGLRAGIDFKVGYSPERINPGDKANRLENITKIVSGIDEESLALIAQLYELIIDAGLHLAPSIKIAEAAKVVENAQRDVNIAFMNELSMLFHELGIDTKAVLDAASTKWNFMPFSPGLVGGHCIGIDPYYLTYKAENTGFHSRILLTSRVINEGMGAYIAQQAIKLLVQSRRNLEEVTVAIFGLAYKENSADIRNTKVVDIVNELHDYRINTFVVDPLVDPEDAYKQCELELVTLHHLPPVDVIIVAVPHDIFKQMNADELIHYYRDSQMKIFIDLKSVFDKNEFITRNYNYWSL